MSGKVEILGEKSLSDFLQEQQQAQTPDNENGETTKGEGGAAAAPGGDDKGGESSGGTGAKAETAKPDDKAGEAAKPAPAAKPAETAAATQDWKESIKKADRKEVLKEMGLDEFDMDFIEFRKNGGNPHVYLEAKTRDWNKMSDVDVLRHELKSQLPPDLEPEMFELMVEKRINQQFKIGETFTDDKDKRLAELELKLKADELRKKFAEDDSKLTIPERKPDESKQKEQEQKQKSEDEFLSFVEQDESTQKFLTTGELEVGTGEDAVKMKVNPEDILPFVKNPNSFFNAFTKEVKNEAGEKVGETLDLNLLYQSLAFAKNPAGFVKTMINKGKSLGVESEKKDLHNTGKDENNNSGEKKESLNEAFRNRGEEIPV